MEILKDLTGCTLNLQQYSDALSVNYYTFGKRYNMKWHPIESTCFEVSNTGIIRNIYTKILRKQYIGKTAPYYCFQVYIGNKKRKSYLVHRLVAKYFVLNHNNKEQVNHKDKNKLNNNYKNLEWVTPTENMAHHYSTGGVKRNNQTYKGKFGKDHNRSLKIKCGTLMYNGISEASRDTGVPISTIHYSLSKNKVLKNGMHFQLASLPA